MIDSAIMVVLLCSCRWYYWHVKDQLRCLALGRSTPAKAACSCRNGSTGTLPPKISGVLVWAASKSHDRSVENPGASCYAREPLRCRFRAWFVEHDDWRLNLRR